MSSHLQHIQGTPVGNYLQEPSRYRSFLRRMLTALNVVYCVFTGGWSMLDQYQWYRKAWGGHWELWYVEPCHSEIWHDIEECSKKSGHRPTVVCRGTPICEFWDELPPGNRYSGPPVRYPGTGYQPIGPVRLACRHRCKTTWHPNDDHHFKMLRCQHHNEPYTYFLGYVGPEHDSPPPRSR